MVCERARRDIWQGEAAEGTARVDTLVTSGEPDRGFSVFCNWNLLDDGAHTSVPTPDGEEFGRAGGGATTLGAGAEKACLGSVVGECVVEDFPTPGQRTRLEWQQHSQNFVMTEGEYGRRTPSGPGKISRPVPGGEGTGSGGSPAAESPPPSAAASPSQGEERERARMASVKGGASRHRLPRSLSRAAAARLILVAGPCQRHQATPPGGPPDAPPGGGQSAKGGRLVYSGTP